MRIFLKKIGGQGWSRPLPSLERSRVGVMSPNPSPLYHIGIVGSIGVMESCSVRMEYMTRSGSWVVMT